APAVRAGTCWYRRIAPEPSGYRRRDAPRASARAASARSRCAPAHGEGGMGSMRERLGAAARAALVCALTPACVGVLASPAAAHGHTVKGFLSLQDSTLFFGKVCEGSGGFVDISEGTRVVVRDAGGHVVGRARFGAGRGAGHGEAG